MGRKFAPVKDRMEVYKLVRSAVESGGTTSPARLRRQLERSGYQLPSRETIRLWAVGATSPMSGKRLFTPEPSEELSLFIGVALGDGWRDSADGGKRIRLKVRSLGLASEFANAGSKILGKTSPYRVWKTIDEGGPWYNVKVTSFMLYDFFESPVAEVQRLVEHYPRGFLRGFATAEGCPSVNISKKGPALHVGVVISNSNKRLLKFSRKLLLGLGFHPGKIRLNMPKGKKTNLSTATKAGWLVSLSRFKEVSRFASLIGFADEKKQRKLNEALKMIKVYGSIEAARLWAESYEKIGKRWTLKS